MNTTTRGTLEMIAAMLISGTLGYFVLTASTPVMVVIFWRCVIGGLCLWGFCAARGLLIRRNVSRRVLTFGVLGGVALVSNWLLLFSAYTQSSIAISTAVYSTQPLMLMGLGAWFLDERPHWSRWAWIGVALIGLVPMVQLTPEARYLHGDHVMGVVKTLMAALLWTVATLLTKKLADTPPEWVACLHVTVGVLMLAPLLPHVSIPTTSIAWASVVTLGVVHTALMYVLLYSAVQKLPTHVQGVLTFIYPLTAVAVDWWLFDHRLKPLQLVGMGVILLAVAGMKFGWGERRTPARTA